MNERYIKSDVSLKRGHSIEWRPYERWGVLHNTCLNVVKKHSDIPQLILVHMTLLIRNIYHN